MAKKRRMRIGFPLGGLDRRASYRQQKPYTSPDMENVRPVGTLENRERGGSRPGLVKSHQDDLGSNIRMLTPMVLAPGDDFTAWSDTFGGTALKDVWTQASWATDTMSILPSALLSVDTSVADAAIVRDTLLIDTSSAYTAEALLVPWDGEFHGTYDLYVRLDDTTPAWQTDGVRIRVTMTGSGGVYTGVATSYVGGVADATSGLTAGSKTMTGGTLTGSVARPVWLIAQITSDTIVVMLDGTTIMTQAFDSAQNGVGVGIGMECTEAGGLNLCNVFRVQYYSTGSVDALRTQLITSAGGNIYKETRYGRMTVLSTSLTVRDDVPLTGAEHGQKLYIADYGDLRATGTDGVVSGSTLDSATYADWTTLGILTDDDVCVISNGTGAVTDQTYKIQSVAAGAITLTAAPGDGNCSFRIERAPKVYDPIADTLVIMTATAGQVPTGNPLSCRFLGRIFLAGAEIAPHVWYASKNEDPLDWDYADTTSSRAVAGTAADAGLPGAALTALAPHSDDYLIMGCRNSIWRLRGDPAFGGSLDALSRTVGIAGQNAWCFGPGGELIFLSLDGVYILPAGGNSEPISVSREALPQELLNFNPDTTTVLMEYDVNGRGVHIYLTQDSSDTRTHWWMDWETKTFWPVTITTNYEPTAICSLQATAIEDMGVILGGRDGYLRRLSDLAETDDGTAYTTYVDVGPIPLAPDGIVGTLMELDAVIAENSADVTWEVYPGKTFEEVAGASSTNFTGTWVAGINATVRPGGRGQAYKIRITGSSGRRWSFEQIVTKVREAGRRRIA